MKPWTKVKAFAVGQRAVCVQLGLSADGWSCTQSNGDEHTFLCSLALVDRKGEPRCLSLTLGPFHMLLGSVKAD